MLFLIIWLLLLIEIVKLLLCDNVCAVWILLLLLICIGVVVCMIGCGGSAIVLLCCDMCY